MVQHEHYTHTAPDIQINLPQLLTKSLKNPPGKIPGRAVKYRLKLSGRQKLTLAELRSATSCL